MVALSRSRTYDLIITSDGALPLSYGGCRGSGVLHRSYQPSIDQLRCWAPDDN